MRRTIIGGILSASKKFSLARAILGLFLLIGFTAPAMAAEPLSGTEYLIGPGDGIQIFVWHNADLSTTVPVRPDGKISIPLVEDIPCSGKTPTQLARDIEERLRKYVQDPTVTVIMSSFVGLPSQQVRIVGQATQPKAVPFRDGMSILDAMIAVGGLNTFAAGNRTRLVRMVNGREVVTIIRLQDLLEDGDFSVNAPLHPGDTIIIPQSFF